ncbi:MAG: hypothetical protein GX252_06870 [Enterococcus cecorum]|nr:hypothetical protein [Enterococcus cecorum]
MWLGFVIICLLVGVGVWFFSTRCKIQPKVLSRQDERLIRQIIRKSPNKDLAIKRIRCSFKLSMSQATHLYMNAQK